MKTKKSTPPALTVDSQQELALLFGVSPKTVWQWLKDGAPAKTSDGYDLRGWIAWRLDRLGASPGDESIAQVKLRKTSAEADLAQLKFQKENQAVISRQDHEDALRKVCGAFAGEINRMPAGLCTALTNLPVADVRKRLNQWRLDVLNFLFGDGPEPAAEEQNDARD